ncbi:retrovirus-related pol polyprotein from transposon TNT 1-94 [Tanacetum coccineum]
MHNDILAAGSKDRLPMLAMGRYAQWKSRFMRYVDTKPNGDALRKCILEGPYKLSTVTIPGQPAINDSLTIEEQTILETLSNMFSENKAHYDAEKEAIHLILTGIKDEIYSTVDACKTTYKIWIAIERLQQGESLNKQDVKTSLFWEFGRFTSRDGETIESYYFSFFNNFNHNEVDEIRAEKIARNANPLALVAATQQYPNTYYLEPKSHKSYAPTSKQSSSTRSHVSTRHKGKKIAKPITPPSESASKKDSDPEQAQRDKEMQKNIELIAKYFKKIYKPTNNNLRTSSTTRNKNMDTYPRYKNDNQTGQFGNQRTVTVAGAKETLRKQAEQADWLEDTDEEVDEQELEAHYMYMAKIQEVPTIDSGPSFDAEPLEEVDSNVILIRKDMCDNENQSDQNAKECDDERDCKSALEECKSSLENSDRTRDTCIITLQNKKIKLEKYKTYLISPYDTLIDPLKNIFAPDREETLTLEQESKSKLNKDLVKPYDYTKQNSLSEIFKPSSREYLDQLAHANEVRKKMWRKYFVKTKPNIVKNIGFLPTGKSISKSRQAYNVMTNNTNHLRELLDQAWEKHSHEIFCAPTSHDINVLINICLMPLELKTQNDSFKFVSELKQEMFADLQYVQSLEKEIDELESDKADFSNIYDLLLQECVLKDVMCSYLHSLSLTMNCNACIFIKSKNVNIVQLILFIVDSGCTKHITGNLKLLCKFIEKYMGTVRYGNDQLALILGYGDLVQGNIMINRVYYVEGLNHNLFSVGQFCDADLEAAFQKSTCFVRDLQGNDLLTGNRGSDLYTISLRETSSPTLICFLAKSSPTQACKAKRSTFKTKIVPSSKGRLNLLHMDLCGSMRIESINGKKYIMDETPEVLKDFLKMIQRNLQDQVITIHTDRGTKFLNKTLLAYFKEEGIEHQTSTPRTPEQNGAVKRRNRTLVEAARTTLSASKLPLFFWAEAIANACYT